MENKFTAIKDNTHKVNGHGIVRVTVLSRLRSRDTPGAPEVIQGALSHCSGSA